MFDGKPQKLFAQDFRHPASLKSIDNQPVEKRSILHPNQTLFLPPYNIRIDVQKKHGEPSGAAFPGTTEYSFEYSFKGNNPHGPTHPRELIDLAKDISEKIDRTNNPILVALDRGGTALGVAVSIESGLPMYIAFSSASLPLTEDISWFEKGANKWLHMPQVKPGSHVVLIDDEINTGYTYLDAITQIQQKGAIIDQIVLVAEIARRGRRGRDVVRDVNPDVKIFSLYSIPEPVYDPVIDDFIFPEEYFNSTN